MTEQTEGYQSGSAKRNLDEGDASSSDSERSCSPKKPKLEENVNDNEVLSQNNVEGGEREDRAAYDPPPSTFQDLLATQRPDQDRIIVPALVIDDLDLDRESSPDLDFPEMEHLLEKMRPSQSQASKPTSQALPSFKKPRSSVNGLGVPPSASSAKPVSKPKSTQTSAATASQNSNAAQKNAQAKKTKNSEPSQSVASTTSMAKASRHENHWYLDGSIVIHMQSTLFRLHRSALVRKSKYFARVFEEVDEQGLKKIDGCPVIHVKGDACDFVVLLDAIDDGIALLSNEPLFATLASILRASTAFEFESMRSWAVHSLGRIWPNSLDSVTPRTKKHAAESLKLARECDVPSIIKRVLYEIVREGGFGLHSVEDDDEDPEGEDSEDEDEEEDEAGEENEDSSDGDSKVESVDKEKEVTKDEGRKPLSDNDLRLLILARERLASEWMIQALCPPKQICASLEAHANDAAIWAKLVHASGLFEESLYDPLVGLTALANRDFSDQPYGDDEDLGMLWANWIEEGWCADCAPRMEETFLKARAKIWAKLDIWFAIK